VSRSRSVSQGEANTKVLYGPYWVHDAISNMARLIPAVLYRPGECLCPSTSPYAKM
jgi:hypothetical protein